MIPVLQAALLGIVQGLTEFIPVSSSGHLVVIPRLFGWSDPGLAFDVVLHLGTLLAVLVYFREEWIALIRGFITSLGTKPSRWNSGMRLAWFLILATIPAAVAGALLEGYLEDHLRSPGCVGAFLLVGAAAMVAAELAGRTSRSFGELKTRDALVMGVLQVGALAPGLSRSGITVSGGMVSGLNRDAAARFSFMMLGPITAGAGLSTVMKLAGEGTGKATWGVLAVGFIASTMAGILAIRYLLGYLRRGSLFPFVVYSAAAGAGLVILAAVT